MTYETYRVVFICGLVGCIVMFCVTISLFFLLRIPHVVGDLSGRTARRAIDDIRQRSVTGERPHRSFFTHEQGEVTDRITKSGNIAPASGMQTALISNEASIVNVAAETSLLTTAGTATEANSGFEVEYEITYIHADEIITGTVL